MRLITAKIMMVVLAVSSMAVAQVDMATLPSRDSVQLTIYNSADLTLARESRELTLSEGKNKLQFSWANTLIDPTSLEMAALKNGDKIDVYDLAFPPRVREQGLWTINSEVAGKVPMEISYLTSGISWRAFYMGTLSGDEKAMRLQGYVRVTNNSGEDYENAQVRLIVGKVHIIDRIADLARRQHAYGSPMQPRPAMEGGLPYDMERNRGRAITKSELMLCDRLAGSKEIIKEGLSEYFLYTIEGTETIPHGWSKRLPSFEAMDVPVVNLYKYEEERYGRFPVRFLSFANDKDHKLGDTPIPGGLLKVYRGEDAQNHLSYQGQSAFKYIPVDQKVELNLGVVENVVVEPKLMAFSTDDFRYNRDGNIEGWTETRQFRIELRNTRPVPVKVEVKRNFPTRTWKVTNEGDFGKFEKYDANSVKYTIELPANSSKEFTYTLKSFHGTLAN